MPQSTIVIRSDLQLQADYNSFQTMLEALLFKFAVKKIRLFGRIGQKTKFGVSKAEVKVRHYFKFYFL